MPPLRRSVFRVPRMDCAAEESLVRTALDGADGVRRLDFDLPGRSLTVWHAGEAAAVLHPMAEAADATRTLHRGRSRAP